MRIFLVTEGDYSDYHVVAAFSTREKAEKFAKKFVNPPEIEEYELDPVPERVYKDNMDLWYVQMAKDGKVWRSFKTQPYGEVDDSHFPDSIEVRGDPDIFFCFNVWARDEDHAIKIANEKRTQYLANQMWKNDEKTW